MFGGISLLALFVCHFAFFGTFGVSLLYVWRPTERKLALMRPMSLASIFAGLTAFLIGIANELAFVANQPADAVSRKNVLMGAAETLVPLFVTFGFLAVAWVFVAIGQQRQEN
jgi:hypothetical protein